MREALIVWGGWSGHEPERCAGLVEGMLAEEGFKVRVESTTEAFADPHLAAMSLVVPIVTRSTWVNSHRHDGGPIISDDLVWAD